MDKTKRSLGLIFSIMLLDVIGMTIMSPVAPYIVKEYSDKALMVTMITVVYAGAQFVGAPILGKLGDRYGRRPVLLISVFGAAVGYMIFGLGQALWVLLLARMVSGITGGNMATASAYIADVSKPNERVKNFTLIGLAWSIGLILGPALGAFSGEMSLRAPAFIAAVLSLTNVALGFFLLPESLPKERRRAAPIRLGDLNPIGAISGMARKPGLGWLLLVQGLFNLAWNGSTNTESLFLIDKFGAQPWQIGLLMALYGGAIGASQATLVSRWTPRFGERRVASISLLLVAFSGLAVFAAPVLWLVFVVAVLSRGAVAFVFPALTTLAVGRVSRGEQGELMGVTTAIGSLTGVLGPLLAGVSYDRIMPGSPYWLAAVVLVAAALLLSRYPYSSVAVETLPVGASSAD